MAKRPCLGGCGQLVDTTAYKGRCADCKRSMDRSRGTSSDRGYGAEHRAQRAIHQQRIDSGQLVLCWRCGSPIRPGDPWHLGHDDDNRTITRGPECAACNLSAAGQASHR